MTVKLTINNNILVDILKKNLSSIALFRSAKYRILKFNKKYFLMKKKKK